MLDRDPPCPLSWGRHLDLLAEAPLARSTAARVGAKTNLPPAPTSRPAGWLGRRACVLGVCSGPLRFSPHSARASCGVNISRIFGLVNFSCVRFSRDLAVLYYVVLILVRRIGVLVLLCPARGFLACAGSRLCRRSRCLAVYSFGWAQPVCCLLRVWVSLADISGRFRQLVRPAGG